MVVDVGTQIRVPAHRLANDSIAKRARPEIFLTVVEIEKQERKILAFEPNHGDGDEE